MITAGARSITEARLSIDLNKTFDAVVIGSGAGGGSVADSLMKAHPQAEVLMLESGPYYQKEHFNQLERSMSKIYYSRGGVFSEQMNISVAAANAVGGSTAVYTGVSFRPPAEILENWRNEHGLDFLTEEYSNRVLGRIEKDICVKELGPEWDNDNNRLFKEGCRRLGIETKPLRINIEGCREQGFCNLGCTSGAKKGTLEVQVPRAVSNGLNLLYNAEVTLLEPHRVTFTVKEAPANSRANSLSPGIYTVSAETIILSAGALHSPALLMRSAEALNLRNPSLGRYITLHPAYNLNAVHENEISNYRGFPKTAYTDAFSESHGYFLETSFYYPGITAKNNPGFGAENEQIMKNYNRMMSILVLAHDKALKENRINLNRKGKPVLSYTVSERVKDSLHHALHKSAEIFFAAGCKQMLLPGTDGSLITDRDSFKDRIQKKYLDFQKTPLSSAHPQGGCAMGSDPARHVVSPEGTVYGSDHIFVADASLFPDSVHVNPYETVMLLAEHVAGRVSLKLQSNYH